MRAEGSVAPGFEAVHDAFAEGPAKDEGGAQLCVYRHRAKVIDLWTGIDKRGVPSNDEQLSDSAQRQEEELA